MLASNILKGACFGAFIGVIAMAIMSNLFVQDVGYFFWIGDPSSDILTHFGKVMIAVSIGVGVFLNLLSGGRLMNE